MGAGVATLALTRSGETVSVRWQAHGTAAVTGTVPCAAMAAVDEAWRRALHPDAGVLAFAVDDVAWSARERAAAEALVGLFGATGLQPVSEAIARHKAVGMARGDVPTVALETAEAAWWDWPWELVACLPDVGLGPAGCEIVRLVPGRVAQPSRTGARVVCVDDADPVCADAVAHARRRLDALDGPALRRVWHVVAHGAAGLSGHGVRAGDGGTSAAPTLRGAVLSEALPGDVVLLDVCGAGDGGVGGVAAQLAATGLVVIAPRGPVRSDVSEAFHTAWYGVWAGGGAVADGMRRGRQALRAARATEPHGRWWAWTVWTTDASLLSVRDDAPAFGTVAPAWSTAIAVAAALGLALGIGAALSGAWETGPAAPTAEDPEAAPVAVEGAPPLPAPSSERASVEPSATPPTGTEPPRPTLRPAKVPVPVQVTVRPRQAMAVRFDRGPWHDASRVMVWSTKRARGTYPLEGRLPDGRTLSCDVRVEVAPVMACPDVRTGSCTCGG